MEGKILFIAPDDKLAVLAKQTISEINEKIDVYQGSLNEGLKYAQKAVNNGVHIIISRGGTGELLKRNLQIPVVNLDFNSYDVINSINRATAYSKEIGVVGFRNLINTYNRVNDIMERIFAVHIKTEIIISELIADVKIKELYKSGVRVFIGGSSVINAVQKLGYNGVLIESGKESIIDAIKQSRNLLEVQMKEKEKALILNSIIDFAYDGILGTDKYGSITVFNPVIQKITGIPLDKAIGRPVNDVVENTKMNRVLRSGEPELGELQQIGSTTIVTNRVPIVIDGEVLGTVATFQEIEKFQKLENQIRKKLISKGHVAKVTFNNIIGSSKEIKLTKEKAELFAKVDSTVLVLGETGTGKELFTQSIHNASLRKDQPFIAVNCAALPENLLESELFGYVDGAFTGARKAGKAGMFELAHGGTIFLDEISEMSQHIQARFLRVLQEKEVVRLGDDRIIPVDVRIIAATNKDLYRQVKKGEFREDLYYRLCVLRLELPPLRNRRDDIPELVYYFIREKSKLVGKTVDGISDEMMTRLVSFNWPGNIRQLENFIESCLVLCNDSKIDNEAVVEVMKTVPDYKAEENIVNSPLISKIGVLKNIEDETIKNVLLETRGNKVLAAEKLGISVTTLWRRLKQIENKRLSTG